MISSKVWILTGPCRCRRRQIYFCNTPGAERSLLHARCLRL